MPTTKKVTSTVIRDTVSKTLVNGTSKKRTNVTKNKVKVIKSKSETSKVKSGSKKVASKKKNEIPEKQTIFNTDTKLKIKLPSLQLALLSPYRLPVNTEQLAINTARFGGVFFVAVGAFFTLFFASGSFGSNAQLAQVSLGATATNTTQNTPASINCSDPLQYLSTSCATSVNKTPAVEFQVDGSDTITGIVRVRVNVEHADRVALNAYFKTQSREVQITSMQKISDSTWEYYWNTTAIDDGEYKLKALVKNGYGTYEVVDKRYLVVENHPVVTSSTGTANPAIPTATSTLHTSTASTTVETPKLTTNTDVTLSVQPNLSSDGFRFDVVTEKADKVKIYAYHVSTSKNTLLGYALKDTATSWKYKWLSSSFVEGEYKIRAQTITDSIERTSNILTVVVKKSIPATTISTETSTSSSQVVVSNPVDTVSLKPKASISIQGHSPVAMVVGVKIEVESATKVELYSQERYGLAKKYLGSATNADTGIWVYGLDTTKIPNGEYKIIATVKNQYGSYESESAFVKIQNVVAVPYTPKQEEQIKVLTDIEKEVKTAEVKASTVEMTRTAVPATEDKPELQTETQDAIVTIPDRDTQMKDVQDERLKNVFTTFDTQIESELQRLATAFRMNDQKAIVAAKNKLEKLKQESIKSGSNDDDTKRITETIESHLRDSISRTEENVKVTEKIITERTQKEASLDSDKDGIADYDEVAIYKTNPFVADSDKDGFNDGSEVLSGYNPTDPTAETLVAFESPKESGVVREDILEVHSVITATKNEDVSDSPAVAIMSGKALPNSYVTLYIFSTPTIVTVKTEADGSWNYRFDKELEDGKHEVYVGVTDNAGKIVAKSVPFTFVKTAEAFSPANANSESQPAIIVQERTFLSEYMVYLVLSISVVAIGLVLILLGLHIDSRQRKITVVTADAPQAV